jgi:UDP-N-acetylglucosamine 2-epimerase (non-hydrolysing)
MKVCIILGTRPEIIKMLPIVRVLEKRDLEFFILHTGQHYSFNMDRVSLNN